jgi:hypothetical protein
MEVDQQEVARIQDKYNDLVAKAKKYNFDLLQIEGLRDKELQQLFDKRMKTQLEESAGKEYQQSLENSQNYFDGLRKQELDRYVAGTRNKEEYEAALRKIERDETDDRIVIANDYSGTVKKAAEDLKNFRKEKEKQTTKDLEAETEKRTELSESELLARARRRVITSRGDDKLQAQKDELQLRFDLETAYMDKRSEMYKLKEAELQEALADADRQANLEKIDRMMEYVGLFQSALDSLHQYISNRENRMLQQERKRNDQKKNALKKQFDDKLLSEQQYNMKVQKLDEEMEAREREVKRAQAKREKALSLFNAIVNNAEAILKTMASVPFPANVPLAIAQGIAGGLQIAAIANAPLPELGMGNWIRKGDKHKDKSRGIPVMIERDEAVMAAAAMTSKNVYTVTGTTAQITSALNKKGGGVAWEGGAVVQMAAFRQRPASINPQMPLIMEQGGVVRSLIPKTGDDATNEKWDAMLQKQGELIDEVKTMKTKLHAVVSLKEFREQSKLYDDAQQVSGIAQKRKTS